MCGKLDGFMCGQLIALSEHRAVLKAKLWDMDSFVYDVGSSIRSSRTDKIKEELQKRSLVGGSDDDDDDEIHQELSLSTRILLGNYANRVREQRINIVRK
jgi:hypothetical protein